MVETTWQGLCIDQSGVEIQRYRTRCGKKPMSSELMWRKSINTMFRNYAIVPIAFAGGPVFTGKYLFGCKLTGHSPLQVQAS